VRDGTRESAFRFAQEVFRHDPLYVVLYGSAARGTDTDTSDLDFLVVFDTEELVKGSCSMRASPT
jgi:predicted nucleotidyltransferase